MALIPSQLLDPFKVFTTLQAGDTIQPIDRSTRSGQVTDYLHGWGEHEVYCRTTPIPLVSRMVRVVYSADTWEAIDHFKIFFKERIAALTAAIDRAETLKDHIYEYLRDVRTGMDRLSNTHFQATRSYTAAISTLMGSNDDLWGDAVNEVLTQFDVEIFNKCIDRCIPIALKPFVKEFQVLATLKDGDTLRATGGVPRYAVVHASKGSLSESIFDLARTFVNKDTPQTAGAFKSYLAEIFTGFRNELRILGPGKNGFGCRTACRYAWEAREALMTLRKTHVPFSNVKKGGINPLVEVNCSPTSQEDIRAFWAFAIDTWDDFFEKQLEALIARYYDRAQDKVVKNERYIEEFVLIASAREVQVRVDQLTAEIQRQFGYLERERIDQEAVLIAMEMEELLFSLHRVNRQIVPVKAVEILTYIRGDRPPEGPDVALLEKLPLLRKESGDIESLFLMLRAHLEGEAFKRGGAKVTINELCIQIQKMDFEKRELIFFMLEMTLAFESMGGKHEPISPSLRNQQRSGEKDPDPDTLSFFAKFDVLGKELKYKKAALFLLSACVNRNGTKLLPHIRPEMFPVVQLDFKEMERQIQQLGEFIERINLPDKKSDLAAAPFRPSGLRTVGTLASLAQPRPNGLGTVGGVVLPEPVNDLTERLHRLEGTHQEDK